MSSCPYTTLGVARTATLQDIKAAWRSLAQEHHPDKGGDLDTFQGIQAAYELLSDPECRSIYDLTGRTKKGPDIDVQARENVIQTFLAIVENVDVSTTDIVNVIRQNIAAFKNQLLKERMQVASSIGRYENLLNRLHKNDGQDNDFVRVSVEQKIEEIRKKFDEIEFRDKVADKSLEILEGYEYTADSQVFFTNTQFSNWGNIA